MQPSAEGYFETRLLAAPDHILVATDLGDGDYLMPHAIAQAKASGARVTLFHVIQPGDVAAFESGAVAYINEVTLDRDVHQVLKRMAGEMQAHGIYCDIHMRHGYAADAICAEISRTGAQRLIMGTHGYRQLLRRIDVPIFAVGPGTHDTPEHVVPQPEHVTPRRILHPVSYRGDYKKGVGLALDLAQAYCAELTLLHVLNPEVQEQINPERTLAWAERAIGALAPPAEELRFPIQVRATTGNVAEEVLRVANETRADWIVLGVDGGFPSWPLADTIAYKLLARAACPVLALRHEPQRERLPLRHQDRPVHMIIA
jgi:nucleotide-binding universal stress UspA family protein